MPEYRRIFILSDSLPLPRSEPELCVFKDTWPALLKAAGFEVYSVSIGGATIRELLTQLDYHKSIKFDIAILQLGIVDAAPRMLTKEEIVLFNYFAIGRKLLFPVLLRYKRFVRKSRGKTYTSLVEFRTCIKKVKELFQGTPVFAIGIIPASTKYEDEVPGIKGNIAKYNNILNDQFRESFLNMENISSDGIMTDHHHLNAVGHLYVFNQIMQAIKTVSAGI